jgi:hypothetical protein
MNELNMLCDEETNINITCDINIDGNVDGKGIIFDNYVITLKHITNNKYICVNNIRYDLLLDIEYYDIAIFCCNINSLINLSINDFIDDFINKLNKFIINKCEKINNNSKYNHTSFKIYNTKYELNFNRFDNVNLKSYLYASIPMGLFDIINISENELEFLCCSGISGSLITYNDKYFGLIISQNQDKIIEVMPFEIILDIIKSYVNNNNFNYLPLTITDNINCFKYNDILKNDKIKRIDNKELIEDKIYIKKYDLHIPYQTYILLFCSEKYVDIDIIRTKKDTIVVQTIKTKLCKYNFNNIFLNYKENNLEIKIFNLVFKELSEEFLIKNIHKNIFDINYDNIFNKKKLIYLEKFDKFNIFNRFNIFDRFNMEKDIYILHKISGHNINKLSDIKKYLSNKKITFELIHPNNDIIKIKM